MRLPAARDIVLLTAAGEIRGAPEPWRKCGPRLGDRPLLAVRAFAQRFRRYAASWPCSDTRLLLMPFLRSQMLAENRASAIWSWHCFSSWLHCSAHRHDRSAPASRLFAKWNPEPQDPRCSGSAPSFYREHGSV